MEHVQKFLCFQNHAYWYPVDHLLGQIRSKRCGNGMAPRTVLLLLGGLTCTNAILQYGRCPRFEPEEYNPVRIERFERIHGGELLFFSNVRFERLYNDPPAEELYVSDFAIQLEYDTENEEDCFKPFELIRKTENMTRRSSRSKEITLINTKVIALIKDQYMFAFSCVEDGQRKLEYLWILRNRRVAGSIGKSKVQKIFGTWLANTTTKVGGLITSHDQLPFCPDYFWETIVYCFTGVALVIAVTSAIVYWKKNKRIILLTQEQDLEKDGTDDLNLSRMRIELATISHQ